MKTFDDLEFKPHPICSGLAARMNFDNGYGISVVRFKMPTVPFLQHDAYGSYTSNKKEWEVAVLKNNSVCYTTSITDNVIGHMEESEVTKIMARIQRLKKEKPKNEEVNRRKSHRSK